MSKLAKWVLAAALVAVVAGGAQAQRQPGGGGRGMGMQQSIFMTALTNAELQKELKITDDQKKALKPMMEKAEALNKERQEMFAAAGGGGGGFDREKMQAMLEKGQKLGEEVKAAAEKALTPEQVKRAKQIEMQVMGLRAFANEEVAKTLKVTDDQKEKLKGIMEEYGKESMDLRQEYGIRGFGGGGGGGGNVDQAKMAEYQKKNKALTDETTEKVMKAMTDEQKKAWKEMTGEPFDTTKLMPRPMRRDN